MIIIRNICFKISFAYDIVYIEGPAGPPGPKGEPGIVALEGSSSALVSKAIVMKDIEELQRSTLNHGEGTLAFVSSEQSLLIRTSNGWQYITVFIIHHSMLSDSNHDNCFLFCNHAYSFQTRSASRQELHSKQRLKETLF